MNDRHKFINEQIARFSNSTLEENISLAEILQEMSNSDKNEIRSFSRRILVHLLKMKVQPSKKSKSWLRSIFDSREAFEDKIDDSPSLKSYYTQEMIEKAWPKVLRKVSFETGIDVKKLPQEPIFTVDDVLNLSIDDLGNKHER